MGCTPQGCYSVEDIAAKLKCSKENVYRLIRNEGLNCKLPKGNSKKGLYIKEEDYRKWEQERWS